MSHRPNWNNIYFIQIVLKVESLEKIVVWIVKWLVFMVIQDVCYSKWRFIWMFLYLVET